MKRLALAIAALVLFVATVFIWWPQTTEPSPGEGQVPDSRERDLRSIESALEQTRSELYRLQRRVIHQPQPAAPGAAAIARPPAEEVDEVSAAPPEENEADEQRYVDDAATELDGRFADESTDSSWSAEVEGQIYELRDTELFTASTILSAECRRSMCRVHLAHESGDDQRALLTQLQFTPPFNTEGFVYDVGTPEEPESVVYVAHAKQALFANAQ